MSTGVGVSDDAVAAFAEFKKSSNQTTYVIFKIMDGKIEVESQSEDKDFNAFLAVLPESECRYAAYKREFTTNDGRPGTKLVSIAWSPDTSKVKDKMIYAGSKASLTSVLVGVAIKIAATDASELTADILDEACRKFA